MIGQAFNYKQWQGYLMQEYPDILDIAAGDKNFIFAAFSLL
jgi:hypothetical protein